MRFKQYLKITIPDGSPFYPCTAGFPQLKCKGFFPHIIWEEATTNFWFVDEKGVATYTPNFWINPSDPFNFISSQKCIAEPMNPRFLHSDPNRAIEWAGYLELIDKQIWHIYYDSNKEPAFCSAIEMFDLNQFVKKGIWKQIPPIQNSPLIKSKHIPAKKPELKDIFYNL